ncbi:dienelactone hydrolase family protein [Tamlana crocina]|uniref:Dienelactone hydrolase family protein n=1 Tax=Tamlana crocina TaxID=393006 RepID=A0ABX1D9N1_9FLAO|nr:dienelactone hydrolase family protein [Tamlana crocina]NJX15083.1 dienelactone hydrolase family protein [Tamlana crocina]
MKNLFLVAVMAVLVFASCKDKQKSSDTEKTVTETIELEAKEVEYSTDSITMKGYLVHNKNTAEKRPGIIVIHEWWGHNDYVRKRADMLAELGYTAMAIDMYGNGKEAAHPEDAGKFSGVVRNNVPLATARFDAALEVLKNHPSVDSSKIAAIGYCFGGSMALTMANTGKDLDAVAAFHSGVKLPVMPNDKLKAKVLVANGGADPFIPKETVDAFKAAMDSINADYEYIEFPEAQHAFTSKGADALGEKFNLPLKYNAEADAQSWQALKDLLYETF